MGGRLIASLKSCSRSGLDSSSCWLSRCRSRPRPPRSQVVPGSMDVHWNEGSPNCPNDPQPPLQEHPYNAQTFILRENLARPSRHLSRTF
jgi:hypothetical protein